MARSPPNDPGSDGGEVLAPLITDRDADWARVTTPDGGSHVFGIDEPASGLTFNHATGPAIWAVLLDVAHLGGFTVMLPPLVPPSREAVAAAEYG